MVRTQISLDEALQRALRTRSVAEGRSVASIIREAVAQFLSSPGQPRRDDPFLAIAGKHSGGPGDAAQRHDSYAYQRRRRPSRSSP